MHIVLLFNIISLAFKLLFDNLLFRSMLSKKVAMGIDLNIVTQTFISYKLDVLNATFSSSLLIISSN